MLTQSSFLTWSSNPYLLFEGCLHSLEIISGTIETSYLLVRIICVLSLSVNIAAPFLFLMQYADMLVLREVVHTKTYQTFHSDHKHDRKRVCRPFQSASV